MNHVKKKGCYNCMACQFICPQSAISYNKNKNGEVFPVIDKSKCINCGLCKKKCINFQTPKMTYDFYHVGAVSSKDTVLKKGCSSGGIATELSLAMIKKGGVVYGASYNNGKLCHTRVSKIDELDLIKGSKYLESTLENVFSQINNDLKQNIEILFIGTPCQVATILNVFNNNSKIVTVSFPCGGVPTRKFLDYELKLLKIEDWPHIKIKFRESQEYVFSVYDEANNLIVKKRRQDSYYLQLFDAKLSLKDSCIKCKFSCKERIGDITIGDYWGFEYNKHNELYKPMSFIYTQSKKGDELFNSIRNNLYYTDTDRKQIEINNDRLTHKSGCLKLNVKRKCYRIMLHTFGYKFFFNVKKVLHRI